MCKIRMRFASQVWNTYKNNAHLQDLMETAVGAGVGAGYQALFTDLTPTEIALSTGAGAAGALAMRPLMARAGYAAGRQIDKRFNVDTALNSDPMLASLALGTPGNLAMYKRQLAQRPDDEMAKIMMELSQAKHNQNFIGPDGKIRGAAEGLIGMVGRQYGDNIAQLGVAVASPAVLAALGQRTPDERKIEALKAELAALEGR